MRFFFFSNGNRNLYQDGFTKYGTQEFQIKEIQQKAELSWNKDDKENAYQERPYIGDTKLIKKKRKSKSIC